MTALHRAAAVGSTNILRMLISACPDVDLSVRISRNLLTPLHLAAAEGQTPMVSFLAANGAKVQLHPRNSNRVVWNNSPPPVRTSPKKVLTPQCKSTLHNSKTISSRFFGHALL